MKKILRSVLVGSTVGAIGLAACDAAPPPSADPSQPIAAKTIPESPTLVDVVRAALADAVRDPDPYSRARRLATLLPTLGSDSVPAVTETLKDLLVDLKATDLDLLVRFWATHEPEAASNWAVRESPLNFRPVAVYSAVSAWAEKDPEAAVSVALEWSDIPTLESIVPIALVRGWFSANDPPELQQFIRHMPLHILGQRTIAAYVRVLIESRGVDAAMRWAESLPDGEQDLAYKTSVFRRVVDALAQLDVPAALRWCDRHCDGPHGNNMRSIIARNWVLYDGPAALAWLSTLPEGYERDLSVQLTYDRWGRVDRAAALAWMATQMAGGEPAPWLQPTYAGNARMLSGSDPLEAIQWAERIEKDQERLEVLIGVVRVWRHFDEAPAEKWLLQSPLSEEARDRARRPPQNLPKLIAPE